MKSGVAGPAALHVTPAGTPDAVMHAAEGDDDQCDVYISYCMQETGSGGDASAFALRDALHSLGFSVFMAEDKLTAVSDWFEVLAKGIERCKVFVVLCSPTYGDPEISPWTFRELALAANLQKRLFPVWHSGLYPPPAVKLFLFSLQHAPVCQLAEGYVAAGISHEQVAEELAGALLREGLTPRA